MRVVHWAEAWTQYDLNWLSEQYSLWELTDIILRAKVFELFYHCCDLLQG